MVKEDHSTANSIPAKVTISLIGDPGSGKTSIKNRLLGKSFSSNELMTIGADFSFMNYLLDETIFKLKICDIAGQESFETIRKNYLSMSDAALLIFDLTNPESLENTINWFHDYLQANHRNPRTNLPVLMIGNKIDLDEERQVSLKMVRSVLELIEKEQVLHNHLVGYIECSAKTGENIQEGVEKLTRAIRMIN